LLVKGTALLPECRPRLSSELAEALNVISERTVPWLISESHVVLPEAGDVDGSRGKNEHFEKARRHKRFWEQKLKELLRGNTEFETLQSSEQKWAILGFRNVADYEQYLCPTTARLMQLPDPMYRDLFERLLDLQDFTPRRLVAEGYRKDVVMDVINAIMTEKWGQWLDFQTPPSSSLARITEVGKRLLKRALDRATRTGDA